MLIQVCRKKLKWDMGVLAGTKIFGHAITEEARNKVIGDLNEEKLDGMVMTDKVGAYGHNLVGASQMIFLGSLYSQDYENQAIGEYFVDLR